VLEQLPLPVGKLGSARDPNNALHLQANITLISGLQIPTTLTYYERELGWNVSLRGMNMTVLFEEV
jgi:hypothetical protein